MVNRIPLLTLLLLALAISFSSCADTGPALHPVHGKVTYNGKPVSQAQLVFHPKFTGPNWLPVGVTDSAGAFAASTKVPGDGMLPGRYKVTVVWHPYASDAGDGPNQLPAKYASPDTSPLEFEAGTAGAAAATFALQD